MRSDNGLYPQRRLKELISLEYGDSLPNENRLGGHCPVLGSNGIVGYHDKPKVNGPGIVVGRKGSIGQVTWVSEDFWPIDTTYYVEQKTRHDRHWLYYLLEQLHLERLNSATGVPGLNREDAYALSVPVPTEVQTRKIAEIIQAIDDAIEATQAVIKQTRQLKTALLQDLLTNGLPGRHREFKNIRGLGRMPTSWVPALLGKLTTLITSGSRGWSKYLADSGAFFVRSQNIGLGTILRDDVVYVDPPQDQESKRARIQAGDLLISVTGEPGNVACADESLGEAYVSQHVGLVRLEYPKIAPWVTLTLSAPVGQTQFRSKMYGQTRPGLNLDNLEELKIPIPEENEQRNCCELVRAVEEREKSETEKLKQLEINKIALSQGLLTGRISVTGGEESV